MHLPHDPAPAPSLAGDAPWWRDLTGYQWFVFLVATLGWLFDTMDQQLFNLARVPAVSELLGATPGAPGGEVSFYAGVTTCIFMLGWATGGIFFGILGDKVGRAKTMMLTILTYSAFTGLSALSKGVWDFAAYRFLTGLGVGGQFAVGVSLVAEVMSDRARPHALGWLQALSAVGNMMAAVIGISLGKLQAAGYVASSWRAMFLVGLLPSLLAIPVFLKLKEPERWKAAVRKEDDPDLGTAPTRKLGSVAELFTDPRWRRNTIVGMILAFSGVVGLWGIGVFSNDLSQLVLRKHYREANLSPQEISGKLTFWAGMTLLMFNAGAFFGIQGFAKITQRIGRRPAFAISFVLAGLSTAASFWLLNEFWQIFVFVPLMGFCQLALFGGYAIYFPELFPTRLRSTGISFCYNVGRFVAASGPFALGYLTSTVFAGRPEPMRYAGVAMCGVFIFGLLALPFAPETQGKPLPE
ncbi:MFS transporter [Paludisphaera mucosa]|uniref:MFS transporter n=1 Tax=Paludisphaera mucosa TaxID=3030827 RepID=A0ABT6F797_9BACT|nr:MFS transporter [Paludisphaera mucosa]MDG3003458.1 MFS transporter [Paludisphaera mucosa]